MITVEGDGTEWFCWPETDAGTKRRCQAEIKDECRAGRHRCWNTKAMDCAVCPGNVTRTVRSTHTPGVPPTGWGRSMHESRSRHVNSRLSRSRGPCLLKSCRCPSNTQLSLRPPQWSLLDVISTGRQPNVSWRRIPVRTAEHLRDDIQIGSAVQEQFKFRKNIC
jgi:hypothetical protein